MLDFSKINKVMNDAKEVIEKAQSSNIQVRNSTPMSVSDIDKMLKFASKGETEKLKKITNKYIKE